jgi:uncharacterized membrane protein YjfL (UPF0719 family)
MERMQELLSGSGAFTISFLVSLALLGLFVSLYSLVSAHREMTLIRKATRRRPCLWAVRSWGL